MIDVSNNAYVKPPGLHWLLLLVIDIATLGIFGEIWLIRQSRWAKKADPASNSTLLLVISACLFVGAIVFAEYKMAAAVVQIAGMVCYQLGNFRVKSAMETYYNSVEPRGLTLSGPMTFFFSSLYFQYHFGRMAKEAAAVPGELAPARD